MSSDDDSDRRGRSTRDCPPPGNNMLPIFLVGLGVVGCILTGYMDGLPFLGTIHSRSFVDAEMTYPLPPFTMM